MSSLEKVPAQSLFVSRPPPDWFGNGPNADANVNWLTSRFHFSFAEYSDPNNHHFGVLRVVNDDLVQPQRGFGTHPHRDMEIVTYIVEGELTHADSTGGAETLGADAIQYMTAGRGITHSEHNRNETDALRFLQIWVLPRARGLTPHYGSYATDSALLTNRWAHLVTDAQGEGQAPVRIAQDFNLYATRLGAEERVEMPLAEGRQGYLICVDGELAVQAGETTSILEKHAAAKVYGEAHLGVQAKGPSHAVLLEMAQVP